MRSLLTPLMSIALALSSTAGAALPPEESKSVAESVAKIQAKAHKLDANGDGWLSEEETSKGKQSLGLLYGAVKQRVDANRDGRISVTEYIEAQVSEIKSADTNGDGWITRSEAEVQKRKLLGQLLMGN